MPFHFENFQNIVSEIIPTKSNYDSYKNYNNGYSRNNKVPRSPPPPWGNKPYNQPNHRDMYDLGTYQFETKNENSSYGRQVFQKEPPVNYDYNWDTVQEHSPKKTDLRKMLNAKRKFSSLKQEDHHYKNEYYETTPIRNRVDENENVIYNDTSQRQAPSRSQGYHTDFAPKKSHNSNGNKLFNNSNGREKRKIVYDYTPKKDLCVATISYRKRKFENDFENFEENKRQKRFDRFGNTGKPNGDLDLSTPMAVEHSLDEIVELKNFTYTKQWPKRNKLELVGWNFKGRRDNQYSYTSKEETTPHKVALPRPIVIDGSNLAWSYGDNIHYKCKGIQVCVEYFQCRGFQDIIVVVSEGRLRGPKTPDLEILKDLQRKGMLLTCWANSYDDRMILEIAHERGGIVVTNDKYRDLSMENPSWSHTINHRRLPFRFMPGRSDYIMFPPFPNGKSLSDFLHFSDTDDEEF